MTRQDQATQDRSHPETSRGHYLLEVLGILSIVLLLLLIGVDFYQGCSTSETFGSRRSWLSWLTWPLTSSPGSYTSSPTTSAPMTRRSSDPLSSNPSGSPTSTRKGSSATTSLTPTATTAWRAFPSCSVCGLSCLWRLLTMGISWGSSLSSCASPPSLPTSSISGRTWISRRSL